MENLVLAQMDNGAQLCYLQGTVQIPLCISRVVTAFECKSSTYTAHSSKLGLSIVINYSMSLFLAAVL